MSRTQVPPRKISGTPLPLVSGMARPSAASNILMSSTLQAWRYVETPHLSSHPFTLTCHTKANDQTLGAATQSFSGFESSQFPADGLMGMAFQSISVYNSPPVFQTLISEGVLTSPVFGFKFATSGSELFLGGTNCALYTGDFTWVPLTNGVCNDMKALVTCKR